MTFLKKTALATFALLGMAVAVHGAWRAGAEDYAGLKILNERMGATFIVGTKKAVAYYVGDAGACQVSVLVSETYPEQMPYNLAATRFSSQVASGTTAQLATSDGSVMTLTCSKGAKSLVVGTNDQVAYENVRTTN